MITATIEEFHESLRVQGVPRPNLAFVCPMCKTVQSMADLIAAGAGKDESEVQKYIGFSCVGRWTGADGPREKPDGKPCNWTLGGLFRFNEYQVRDEKGVIHPRFRPASPEDARAHMEKAK